MHRLLWSARLAYLFLFRSARAPAGNAGRRFTFVTEAAIMKRWLLPFGLTIVVVPGLGVGPAHAQVPPPGTPASVVQQRIDAAGLRDLLRSRISSSGLTADQIRQRLASMGYDPATLDPYLGDADVAELPEPSAAVLEVVRSLGVMPAGTAAGGPELGEPLAAPSLPPMTAEEREAELRVFGLEVFARTTTEFQPVAAGPVPGSYIIGPGDELVLIVTGDVEKSYVLPVARDGFVVIPEVGQVWVNGLTLDQLRDQLYTHLGRAYSGVRRGPEATTHFEVTLGRLRTNQVFVTGEVVRPGSYLVSPVASVLNALYLAGGPTPNGSFRDVRVMRSGRMAERVDLYEYLLRGDNLEGVQLQPGDVIFVPPHHGHVAVRGEVNREAIYELVGEESLAEAIVYAGGLTSPAAVRRARITRILPPDQRNEPGVDRVVMDVPLGEIVTGAARTELEPGDNVDVFPVRSEVRNTVSIEGAVWHEGSFAFRQGMTAWDLIGRADGVQPEAYLDRAHIVRLDPEEGTLSVLPFSLATQADGTPVEDPELREFDAIEVFSVRDFADDFSVAIAGEVRNPGEYAFREDMTLQDLIVQAGGLRPTAELRIEVARLADPDARQAGDIARIFEVEVDSTYLLTDWANRYYFGQRGRTTAGDTAATTVLRPYDHVYVRRIPDFELPRIVTIMGEVRFPGQYTLRSKSERLTSVLERAGGLTEAAYASGFRLYREGRLVNVDLGAALSNPSHPDNLTLMPGDSMRVPEYNPVVVVEGQVHTPSAVLYREGAGLEYYIEHAGGYTRDADRARVHVQYANGDVAVRALRFVLFRTSPRPRPGSVVRVPLRPAEDRTDKAALIADLAQIGATLTTVLILLARL